MDAIKDNAYATSKFKDVNFGVGWEINTKYYSHLFHLPEEKYRGQVNESSLFNLDTLKQVFATFDSIPDITKSPKLDIEEFIPKLTPLTKWLLLDSNYQTYMLGLYLKYLIDITGNWADVGGSKLKTFVT